MLKGDFCNFGMGYSVGTGSVSKVFLSSKRPIGGRKCKTPEELHDICLKLPQDLTQFHFGVTFASHPRRAKQQTFPKENFSFLKTLYFSEM